MKKPQPKTKPGRPSKGSAIMVRMPQEMIDRVDALAGDKQRPAFIREAVSRELSRRERKGS